METQEEPETKGETEALSDDGRKGGNEIQSSSAAGQPNPLPGSDEWLKKRRGDRKIEKIKQNAKDNWRKVGESVKRLDARKRKAATDEKESKDAKDRVDLAEKKGKNKASAEYAEKKQKCEEKKAEVKAKEEEVKAANDENKLQLQQDLQELQKKFKGLACGKYFDEHEVMHKEAHEKLAGDSAAALADHKNRVHEAMGGDITSGGILKILSETIGKRSNVAMKKVLLKSDELIDVVVAALEQKMKTSGLPAIMGIEIVTGIISFIIDIIPIPGIGILSTAVETAGDVVINVISAVGPDSLIKIVEDKFLPIIEKIAVIFQGLAGSFSCCDKDKRVDKINISSATKKELIDAFKKLKTSITAVEAKDEEKANIAIKKIDEALKFLGDNGGEGKGDDGGVGGKQSSSGGARRRTRRRRHHKTKRKRFRRRKTRVKKKHRKKRTQKH